MDESRFPSIFNFERASVKCALTYRLTSAGFHFQYSGYGNLIPNPGIIDCVIMACLSYLHRTQVFDSKSLLVLFPNHKFNSCKIDQSNPPESSAPCHVF